MLARLLAVLVVGVSTTALAGQPAINHELWRDTRCMMHILRTTSGVHNPKLTNTARHLCLQYDPDEKSRWIEPTTFCLYGARNERPYEFMASLPGIVPVGEQLDFRVTDAVMQKWKTTCGVLVSAVTN
jgi:hypothetical protein